MSMTKGEFIATFLEAASEKGVDLAELLLGKLYDERKAGNKLLEQIEFMDDIARVNEWTMVCRSCCNHYSPDCELSEMFGAENYCGGSDRCCP